MSAVLVSISGPIPALREIFFRLIGQISVLDYLQWQVKAQVKKQILENSLWLVKYLFKKLSHPASCTVDVPRYVPQSVVMLRFPICQISFKSSLHLEKKSLRVMGVDGIFVAAAAGKEDWNYVCLFSSFLDLYVTFVVNHSDMEPFRES